MKLHFARSHGLLNAISRHLRSGIAAIGIVLVAAYTSSAAAQEARGAEPAASHAPLGQDLGRLFDAVVATTKKSFWDKQRLSDWQRRAAEVRPAIVAAASLSDATDGINELLGGLKASHTLLLPTATSIIIFCSTSSTAREPRSYRRAVLGCGRHLRGDRHFFSTHGRA